MNDRVVVYEHLFFKGGTQLSGFENGIASEPIQKDDVIGSHVVVSAKDIGRPESRGSTCSVQRRQVVLAKRTTPPPEKKKLETRLHD